MASRTAPTPSTAGSRLDRADMEAILAVTRALALPFDLRTMLAEVAAAACSVLRAERASVWLLDSEAQELLLEVGTNGDLPIRLALDVGIVGACARSRTTINVADCYADPRFSRAVDLMTGFRTRCSLSVPLIDYEGSLVGVLQVLNREGAFDQKDEPLATALAAQCATALSRVRMTTAIIAAEAARRELDVASMLQRSTLPTTMPVLTGYDMHGLFVPASVTGGDTFDLSPIAQGLLVVLGDATGHGIAPALSVTQMHAMLRMAFNMGADLVTAFCQVNDQLARTLPDGRFVTAFIGLLDVQSHVVRFLSGGQAPILHFRAATGGCDIYRATSFPMGAMALPKAPVPVALSMQSGDWLVLLSDGVFEAPNRAGEPFGRERVENILRTHHRLATSRLAAFLLAAVREHADGASQDDDITIVLVRRLAS